MYITYYDKAGVTYARCDISKWVNGAIKKEYINLGRVLDKERHIFRNRERGEFTFDPNTHIYGKVPEDFISPGKTRRSSTYKIGRKHYSRLVLQFGDIFFYNEFFKILGIKDAVDAIAFSNKDTLYSLLCYYVTSSEANCYAEDWYELSYARVLWPNANMSSQRISEALEIIGLEENKRAFFARYYDFVRKCQMTDKKSDYGMIENGDIGDGILIDSSGLPNEAKLPVTGVNNHNGVLSMEVRLIYVVQQSTGLPLYYRYVPGNIIDASTLKRTTAEIKAMHINTKFALLDAGYYNGKNADILIEANISFVTRVHGNHKIFTEAVKNYREKLESADNILVHRGRIMYVQEVEVQIGSNSNHRAYGYLCLDTTMQNESRKHLSLKAIDEDLLGSELFDELQKSGLFMLVATRKVRKDHIIQLYFTRNQVEEIFKIGKKDGKMLPLGVESESTLRGHLMMTFISSTILKILSDRLIGTQYTISGLFALLRHQSATIYEKELITSEEVKKMNYVYKHFAIKCPATIPYSPTPDELQRI